MATNPALCQAHGSLLSGAEAGLLSGSPESLCARRNIAGPLPSGFCGSSRARSARQYLLLITAQDDGFLKKGTRIFKFGNKKEAASEEAPAAAGTRLFRFATKKQQAREEEEVPEEEEPKFGTKLFGFGPKKEAGAMVLMKKSSDAQPWFARARRQDANTVFVAGATGQVGARIAQKLLREGFSVRGGVRDLFVAQQLAEFATQYGVVSREDAKRLNAVEFDFRSVESIAKAIGSAAKVVVTIGPTEDGPKSKVSFDDASNVVEAAKLANVPTLVVVYEPGTAPPIGNPLAGLTSFFSDLFSKPAALLLSELLSQIVDSELSYTVLKASLTDGVDDFSADNRSIDLRKEGTPITDGSKISKRQVASVVAEVLINPAVAQNKVMEVFTSSAVAASSLGEFMSAIPTDGRRAALAAAQAKAEEEKRERQAREKVEAEARAAVEEARQTAQLAAQLEAEAKQLAAEEARAVTMAERAQLQAAAAAASVEGLASKMKELGPELLSKTKAGSLNFSLPSFPSPRSVKTSPKPKSPPSPPKKKPVFPTPVASVPASKPQINTIFGGLFTQETVYVDEA